MFKKLLIIFLIISICSSIMVLGQRLSFAGAAEIAQATYQERNYEDSKTILGVNNHISMKLNRASEAFVVETTAFAREIIRRPESVLDLSCFSKSFLPNFANLGKIYSDLRFAPNFSFTGNPLCQAVNIVLDFGLKGSLFTDLMPFFKVPGLNLPPLEVCGPKINIESEITSAIKGALAATFPGAPSVALQGGQSPFGCLLTTDLAIKGDFEFESPCITVKIPSATCGSLSKLLNSSVMKLVGNVVPLNKPYNKGGLYASMNDKGRVAVGLEDTFQDSGWLKKTKDNAQQAEDFINKWGDFSGVGIKYEGGGSLDGAYTRSASADGVTSDGGFSKEKGSLLSAGNGEEFKEILGKGPNKDIFSGLLKDIDELKSGPGKSIGWRPKPKTWDGIDLKQVVRDMMETNSDDDQPVRE